MKHYCTYFDHNYLARALVMFRSLKKHSTEPFCLWVLALSTECERLLEELHLEELHLEEIAVIPLEKLETAYPELLQAKGTRNRVEYYFTCTPSLPLYVLAADPSVDAITYLDSDMCFFADPANIFEDIGTASIAITPHRFSPQLRDNEKCGLFNVGWLTFLRDEQGLDCLQLWQRQCLDWCYDRLEDGKYGDQKYLDAWPARYSKLHIINHPGVNTAIWNISAAQWSRDSSGVQIDGRPLVLFHFHGIKEIAEGIYDVHWRSYGVPYSDVLVEAVYTAYLNAWLAESTLLAPRMQEAAVQDLRKAKKVSSPIRRFRHWLRAHFQALSGRHFVVRSGQVIRTPRPE